MSFLRRKYNTKREGEGHYMAALTDHEVELVRSLREEGYSYQWIADKMEVGKSTVADICLYKTRGRKTER